MTYIFYFFFILFSTSKTVCVQAAKAAADTLYRPYLLNMQWQCTFEVIYMQMLNRLVASTMICSVHLV